MVRLKSEIRWSLGEGGEEIDALRSAGVPFAVVPGVTAAMAAAASLDLPLTDRTSASKLVLITGHHAAGSDAEKPVWTGTLPDDATLAVYMPGRDLGRLGRELMDAGGGWEGACGGGVQCGDTAAELCGGAAGGDGRTLVRAGTAACFSWLGRREVVAGA